MRRGDACSRHIITAACALLLIVWWAALARAQGTKADYARSDAVYWSTYGSVRNPRVVPHWGPDGSSFWYATMNADGYWRFWWVDAKAATRRLAVDPSRLAGAMGRAKLVDYGTERIPIQDVDPLADGKVRVDVGGMWVTIDPATYELTDPQPVATPGSPVPHPITRLPQSASTRYDAEDEDVARVVVVNRTGAPIKVEKVLNGGTRELLGDNLENGPYQMYNVWSGQVLTASNKDGETLGFWRADHDGGMLVVEAPPGGSPRHRSLWQILFGPPAPSDRATSRPTTTPATTQATASLPATLPTTGPATAPATFPTTFSATRPTTWPTSRSTTRPQTQPTTSAAAAGPHVPGASPDGRWIAFFRDHNVWLRDRRSNGTVVPLTTDGTAADGYVGNDNVYWSPDSAAVVALRWTAGEGHQYPLLQSIPPTQLQPRTEMVPCELPGDRIGHYWPHLFDVAHRRETPITGVDAPDPERVTGPLWDGDPARFTFTYDRRGHQLARTFVVETATGRGRQMFEERSGTFIDLRQRLDWYDAATHQELWMSERDGWNHIYRYDATTGRLTNQVTKGHFAVQPWDDKYDAVDVKHNDVFFRATGFDADQDPYYVHYCRANLDGTGLQDLTPADGTHSIQESPSALYYLDTYSRVDQPPTTELRRYGGGGLVCPLEQADWSNLLMSGWRPPERFTAKGRDGTTDICGVIYRPTNFNPATKYPVVEDIYAGPQMASVPKAFSRWYYPMSVAELGFVVVQIDGMGTPGRSKPFHDACWHNWADCGFPDRIAWVKAAAAKNPEMDLNRVGIYGGSFGGYAALRALEDHGDFYKVAVAENGCHDPRLYKQWYAEQYLGWPVGPWYADQSNATHADRVTGRLLLIESELDHNVDPASTTRVVDALEKANKDFDLLVVPNADHTDSGPYADRRRKDFLVRNLLGVEPRAK